MRRLCRTRVCCCSRPWVRPIARAAAGLARLLGRTLDQKDAARCSRRLPADPGRLSNADSTSSSTRSCTMAASLPTLTVVGELHTANDATEVKLWKIVVRGERHLHRNIRRRANWSLSGSVHMSDRRDVGNRGVEDRSREVGTRIGSYFQYAEFKRFRSCPTPRGTVKVFLRNEVQPTNWNGEVDVGRNYENHYLDGHCPPMSSATEPKGCTDTGAHTYLRNRSRFPMPRAYRSSGSGYHSKPRADGRTTSSRYGRSAMRFRITIFAVTPEIPS